MSNLNMDLRILVVDDDAFVREILVEYLKSFGFSKIVDLKDGAKAIHYIQDLKNPIDLIISDWEMPQVGGLQLLQAVRKHPQRKHTQFMMVTSQRSQERMKITRAALWSVDAYLVKPFRGEILLGKIEELFSSEVPDKFKIRA